MIVLISEDLMAEGSENGSGVGQESEGRPPFSTRQVCKLWSTSFFLCFNWKSINCVKIRAHAALQGNVKALAKVPNSMRELRIHVKFEACLKHDPRTLLPVRLGVGPTIGSINLSKLWMFATFATFAQSLSF